MCTVVMTHRRLRLYALVIPIGLVVGLVVLLVTSHGLRSTRGGRIGGDFPAFYGAARMIRAGEAQRLYDWQAQRAVQRDLFPEPEQGWIAFAYPPFVAVAYVPLTLLPFKWAYAAHTLAMMALCAMAVAVVCRLDARLRQFQIVAVAAALGFYPVLRAVLGGQNTSISLMCAAGTAAALTRRNTLAAGVWSGAWIFKPQLALPVAALVALRSPSRSRFLLGAAISAAVCYAVATIVAGPAWPVWWWQQGAVPFSAADRVIDRENVISLFELGSTFSGRWLGWLLAALTAGFAVWVTLRQNLAPIELVAIASAMAVLIAPHALYYDAGLAAFALMLSAARRPYGWAVVVGLWLLGWAQPFRSVVPIPPLTIVVVAALWLASRPERSDRASAAQLGNQGSTQEHRVLQ